VFCCLVWGAADFPGGSAQCWSARTSCRLLAEVFGLLTAVVAVVWSWVSISASSAIGAGREAFVGIAFIAFYRALTLAPMGVVATLVATIVVIPVTFGAPGGQWRQAIGMIGLAVGIGPLLAPGCALPARIFGSLPR